MSSGWLRTRLRRTLEVREVIASSIPVILSRGAIQVSALIDGFIASWLGRGAVAAIGNAQQLYTFPVSLFGMAISSASLPAMSYAEMLFATVPAAPPTAKNHRATSWPP